ncbi:MAG TPA: nitroreductase family protein [Treponemataceae bacterium]|nr:nitroreductase family protein [Treponemataceae bacterium]
MTRTFTEALANRRSIYALGNRNTVGNEKIRELVEFAVKHVPSAFNSQSARVVLLFGAESNRFWTLVRETLKKIVPADAFPKTAEKLATFDAGLGTVLFFEDQAVVENLMGTFPLYKDNFPVWSLQSNGMLEFAVWTSLEDAGLGASLQHYNPLVDDAVKKAWNIPSSWKLLAEMPFGSVESPAGDKEYSPIEGRVKVFG